MLQYIQVGDLGKNRDQFITKVQKTAGKGNWFWAFRANKRLYSWEWGLQLYEDAYWHYLRSNVKKLKEIIAYNDVYVYNRHETESVLDYKIQKHYQDHYEDIAIRRCLIRFGVWFTGKELLSIKDSPFDDAKISFHLPHLINKPDATNSIRSWLNTNRMIVIASEIEDKCRLAEILVK